MEYSKWNELKCLEYAVYINSRTELPGSSRFSFALDGPVFGGGWLYDMDIREIS